MIRTFELTDENTLTEVGDFDEETMKMRCWNIAVLYSNIKGNTASVEELYEAILNTEVYNERRYKLTDTLIDYNDEIESIECLEEFDDMYDISVAGDQLFYANGILTKNSIGLVATVDMMLAVIETDELAKQGIQLFKQLKSRYGDKNYIKTFQMLVKKGNQRWVEMEGGYSTSPEPNTNSNKQEVVEGSKRAKIDGMVEDMIF